MLGEAEPDYSVLVMSFSWLGVFLGGYLVGKRSLFKKCFHGLLPLRGFYHVFICGFKWIFFFFFLPEDILMEASFGQRHGANWCAGLRG